ncbi:N-acetylmuramic acid 6-phosphate etherase [Psychrosphaera haliotis]|uniref:N-acetylmuramic acid 6-phosphate etherase n=1 Tax=Psychrosphaera haliotis TaxID=555083 RepID=A0A6N8F775_9GAMM|nr:N-acetylmuramic acid 6-phosphate etherase [Psychrosphaera haliotis]MUH72426.1 N-acetylmuramic acid 6-phosphate etherase [Psychrosphaera haliotis]
MKFIIGIDGGGTKTVGQIVNLSNSQRFDATTGPSSLSQDVEKASETLSQLITDLIQQANAQNDNVSVAIGVAGGGNSSLVRRCQELIINETGISQLAIVEDCETALLGAKGASLNDDVALVTLGTGSFVATSLDNKSSYSGGWGFPVGDEGSGAKLGFYLVNHYLKMWDASQAAATDKPPQNQDPLYSQLVTKLGANKDEILHWLSSASQSDFSSLAPLAFEFFTSSKLAKAVLNKHLQDVVELLSSIKSPEIILTGGLANNTLEHLIAADLIPNITKRIRIIKSPSLLGALLMAESIDGIVNDDRVINDGLVINDDLVKNNDSLAGNNTLADSVQEDRSQEATTQSTQKNDANLTPLDKLVSEQRNPASTHLDIMNSQQIVSLMNEQDMLVPQAIETVSASIAEAIDTITHSLNNNGRLIYMGAGTSGRLGVLDAVECPPTFSTNPNSVIGLLAGGEGAMFKAVEGAEDSVELGQQDLVNLNLTAADVVVGIAASGRTPYVIGGLNYAKSLGCQTISVTCNPVATINDIADIPIAVNLGPEVLSGSTRLKAGSAQKMILNMLSTGTMVQLGKCYENLMVDVKASNHKLVKRACRIIEQACDVSFEYAEHLLNDAQYNVKLAILMHKSGLSRGHATQHLANHNGFLRRALESK